MANFMALTARDRVISRPEYHSRVVIYVSDLSHFSIAKCTRVLGFAEKQVRQVAGFQPSTLASLIRDDWASGLIPMVAVATLGSSTSTGSNDPISEAADVAAENNI